MARRTRKAPLTRALQRTLNVITRPVTRTVSQAMTRALQAPPSVVAPSAAQRVPVRNADCRLGLVVGLAGARRYWLYKPPGLRRTERLPLVVMLHGCGQNAEALAASSQMNRIAERQRFLVLYPEQGRLANAAGCWNWYETRSGRAQGEAGTIEAAIDQVCLLQPVDPERIALAGLSAGAGMAALLATRRPERFRAIAMHSGIAPGVAYSPATALMAMGGRQARALPLAPLAAGVRLPGLLVIHGSSDPVVAPSNGAEAARSWAARIGAKAGTPRTVQRGARYAATITDYRCGRRLVASLCEVKGLGHAWSGGAAGQACSDPKGPDASRMIWAFMVKQFARGGD